MENIFESFSQIFNPANERVQAAKTIAKSTVKQSQLEILKKKIYTLLMQPDEMDMGEMGDCEDEAWHLIIEWVDEIEIEVIHDLVKD